MLSVKRIQLVGAGSDYVSGHALHLWVNSLKKIVSTLVLSIEINLEILIRDLIAFFESAIVRQIFLNCIISKMDVGLTMIESVLRRCGSEVTSFEPIPFESAIN